MFLAESIAAFAFMLLFWYGYASSKGKKSSGLVLFAVGIASFVILFSAPVYIFSVAILVSYIFIVGRFEVERKWLLWLVLLYSIIPITMLFQGAIKDFYYAYVEFNSQIYYPLRLKRGNETALISLLTGPWVHQFAFVQLFVSVFFNFLLTLLTTLKQFAMDGSCFCKFG
jgi:hypothetical protein